MNMKLMYQQHPSTSRILPLGKSAIQVEQAQPETEAFVDGLQAGHLACMAYWRMVPVTDTEVIFLVTKQRAACCQSSPSFQHGYLVGRLSTLVRHGRLLLPTGPSFARGWREGVEVACQYRQRVLTLDELCTLLREQHGTDSAQQAGYLYGLIEELTNGIRTVKPYIPGEGC